MFSNSVFNFLPIQVYSPAGVNLGRLYAGSQNQPMLALNGATAVSVVLPDRLSYEYMTPVLQGATQLGLMKFNSLGQLIFYPSTTPVPPVPPFNPSDIAGLTLWLDASDSSTLTLNGTNVSQWNDKSGNGNNATQATMVSQPVYGAASLN